MKKSRAVANRFREVLLNGTWIANTNFKNQLENIHWEIAVTRILNLNTIADLVQHIHYYINGINQVFAGGNLAIKDEFSFSFPPVLSQEDWQSVLNKLWIDAEVFATYVETLKDEELEAVFVDKKYGSYLRNIEGMIEHSYYHLGQIVLIRKLIENQILRQF
ncbi:DUF1572 domain-containing protein [Flavobacterium sp. NST-5]|uniref:DUF1572 domain-containing protein n=1 Tax=Flavobacterium ichthyis TaxID=2698827 RepID=A0ABW9Z556_9FLAO|nr:DUF1572 family protein [Flavobacterium ichthyis]NBL63970.1 DUF1572 domain-containing protein [Flavobacterium ichthyis]